jgi:tripeptide aminopeptidase
MEYLIQHPEIKHGKIRIGFTPDEEIGRGADHFNVEAFGAEWAYTMDGSEIGELEFENFNAASAKVIIKGLNVHPGYAKHVMRNSMRIAHQFISMLPRHETPEHTEGYEGFYHLTSMTGDVETSTLHYIIRDHDGDRFERRKKEMQHLVNKINAEFGADTASVELKDQYYNMREKVEPVKFIVDLAHESMLEVGVNPIVKPIRGGTDGARLSFMGLPCPNISAGGHNFHGRFEYVPVQSMEKATQIIITIAKNLVNFKK